MNTIRSYVYYSATVEKYGASIIIAGDDVIIFVERAVAL